MDLWQLLIGQLGIGGALVWYLYYTTSVVFPRMHDEHREDMKLVINQFRDDMHQERQVRESMHGDVKVLLSRLGERPCLAKQEAEGVA